MNKVRLRLPCPRSARRRVGEVMEDKVRKQRKAETAEERDERLEAETRQRAAAIRADDDAVHAMVQRSIERYGA